MQIDDENGKFALLDTGGVHCLSKAVEEQLSIGKSGEGVVVGNVGKPLFLADVIECKRDVASEVLEQFQFFIVEETCLAGVEHHHPDHLAAHHQRHCNHRPKAALQRLSLENDMRVGFYVIGDHQLLVAYRFADGALIFIRCAQQRCDLRKVAIVETFPHQGYGTNRTWFDQANPAHTKSALLNRDTTRFAEQLATVADANDGGIDAAQDRLYAAQPRDPFLLDAALGDVARNAAVAHDRTGCIEQRQRVIVEPANPTSGVA